MANKLNQKLDREIRKDTIKSNLIGLAVFLGMIATIVFALFMIISL